MILICSKYNDRNLKFVNGDEVFEHLNINKENVGVFKNQFNRKVNICIGLCVDAGIASRKNISIIYYLIKQNSEQFKYVFQQQKKNIFKKTVLRVLDQKNNIQNELKRKTAINLNYLLHQLSNESINDGINKIFDQIDDKMPSFLFIVHKNEGSAKIHFGISEAPTIFGFLDSALYSNGSPKYDQLIFKKLITLNNANDFWEVITDIWSKAYEYYITFIL